MGPNRNSKRFRKYKNMCYVFSFIFTTYFRWSWYKGNTTKLIRNYYIYKNYSHNIGDYKLFLQTVMVLNSLYNSYGY